MYKLYFKSQNNSPIHELNVVIEPQNAKPINNFNLLEILKLSLNPNIKHPTIFI